MALRIIAEQLSSVARGDGAGSNFIDLGVDICQSLLDEALRILASLQTDPVAELVGSRFLAALLDVYSLELRPITDITMQLKCLALRALVAIQQTLPPTQAVQLLKHFVGYGGLARICETLVDSAATETCFIPTLANFLSSFTSHRFGCLALLRETYVERSVLAVILARFGRHPSSVIQLFAILKVYILSDITSADYQRFLDAGVIPFVLDSLRHIHPDYREDVRQAGLELISDVLERLYTFKQACCHRILNGESMIDAYNRLGLSQDRVFADLVEASIVSDEAQGVVTQARLNWFLLSTVSSDAPAVPDACIVRLLTILMLHAGERRIEVYAGRPFHVFVATGPVSSQELVLENAAIERFIGYTQRLYSLSTMCALGGCFGSHIYTLDGLNGELLSSYFRIVLLLLMYGPTSLRKELIESILNEQDGAALQEGDLQPNHLSDKGSPDHDLLSPLLVPIIECILRPTTQYPAAPLYASIIVGLLSMTYELLQESYKLQRAITLARELLDSSFIFPSQQAFETELVQAILNCFSSNVLDVFADVHLFFEVQSEGIIKCALNLEVLHVNAGVAAFAASYRAGTTADTYIYDPDQHSALKLYLGGRDPGLIHPRTYLALLKLFLVIFDDDPSLTDDVRYQLFQMYEGYVVPNSLWSLFSREDILSMIQSLTTPHIGLLHKASRELLVGIFVIINQQLLSTLHTLTSASVLEAISRYLCLLRSEIEKEERLHTAIPSSRGFAASHTISRVSFCRSLLIAISDPHSLLRLGEKEIIRILSQLRPLEYTGYTTIINEILAQEIILKALLGFCTQVRLPKGSLFQIERSQLRNLYDDIRRLRNLEQIRSYDGSALSDHLNAASLVTSPFIATLQAVAQRDCLKAIRISGEDPSDEVIRRRGARFLQHALIAPQSSYVEFSSYYSDVDTTLVLTDSLLTVTTSLEQASHAHSNRIKRELVYFMVHKSFGSEFKQPIFAGRMDRPENGFGTNTSFCLRSAVHNDVSAPTDPETQNPSSFLISSRFSQIPTLKAGNSVSLPIFSLKVTDLFDIAAWTIRIAQGKECIRIPEFLVTPDLSDAAAAPTLSPFIRQLFPEYANSTLELAIQATRKAKGDNDRQAKLLHRARRDRETTLQIVYRRVASKICDSVLTALYTLRLIFFGLFGPEKTFSEAETGIRAGFQGFHFVYPEDREERGNPSTLPYKGRARTFYFAEINAEIARLASVALVTLFLALSEGGNVRNMGHGEMLAACSLTPIQTVIFVQLLQETLREGVIIDQAATYLDLNSEFQLCTFNSNTHLTLSSFDTRVTGLRKRFSDHAFAFPASASPPTESEGLGNIMKRMFRSGDETLAQSPSSVTALPLLIQTSALLESTLEPAALKSADDETGSMDRSVSFLRVDGKPNYLIKGEDGVEKSSSDDEVLEEHGSDQQESEGPAISSSPLRRPVTSRDVDMPSNISLSPQREFAPIVDELKSDILRIINQHSKTPVVTAGETQSLPPIPVSALNDNQLEGLIDSINTLLIVESPPTPK
ncbi:hypothetical protein GMRT_14137 [Giardia muris]|uniref:Uncharacterized protein n=1 Tax=Giardia muris TaxID=5742 RepID=A0A4Z1T5F4_GIAMU|nr:hypothetical protein GMRT_14137 [Giardia muris]|eukprot:TNJ28347.1 hypothetical protein GMRT_14137 [Giardia muris]